MKQFIQKWTLAALVFAFISPLSLVAQSVNQETKDKKEAERETIIITRNGNKDEKLLVEVNGDKITVNGKDAKDAKDVVVTRTKVKNGYGFNYNNNYQAYTVDENRALLGVTTEKADNGVEINEITNESGAAKAGLMKGDIITKIDGKSIDTPDELSETIKAKKPGDKVAVTYLRNKKEQKATAELTKWKGGNTLFVSPGQFKMELDNLDAMARVQPRIRTYGMGQNWAWSGDNGPKLGVSIQDSEDGKGVKVIDVDEDGNAAKAGLKEDDLITEVNGKAVNSTDEITKLIRDNKEQSSVKMKVMRKGKVENVEVKIPRRLKSADL